jgi:hypothetical protein
LFITPKLRWALSAVCSILNTHGISGVDYTSATWSMLLPSGDRLSLHNSFSNNGSGQVQSLTTGEWHTKLIKQRPQSSIPASHNNRTTRVTNKIVLRVNKYVNVIQWDGLNICTCKVMNLPDSTVQHPRRQPSSYSSPWEPQILPSETKVLQNFIFTFLGILYASTKVTNTTWACPRLSVCQSRSSAQAIYGDLKINYFGNEWTDFHEIWYWCYVTDAQSRVVDDDAIAYDPLRMRIMPLMKSSLVVATSPVISVCTHSITAEWLDGFSRNLVWTLCHCRLLQTHAF